MSILNVTVNKAELKQAIRRDCVTFLTFYLSEELTLEVPAFHEEIWGEFVEILEKVSNPEFIIGHLQKLFAVPREHSKSTLAKLAVILFMRYSPFSFTIYVSKTNTVAKQACKDIVNWFRSPNEINLYGEPFIEKANESESLWIIHIYLDDGSRKRITLKALGAEQQVRGTLIDNRRPELVIIDDIEDYDTADGGLQQSKLDEWVLGSLMKATARRSVRIMIGNMVRSTTLLARLSKDPDWNPTVFGSIVRDKNTGELRPLWEGRWTVNGLLEDYRKYRRIGMGHVWETEMMNLSQDSLLTQNLDKAVIIEHVAPDDITAGFIALDPAFGQKAWNDESAITVHVRTDEVTIPVLVDHRVGRWTETQILDELIQLSYYWNLTTWAIESVAAQRLLIPLFRLMLTDRLIPPDTFLILPVSAGKEAKASRINAFRKMVGSRNYALAESQMDVKLKLEEYSPISKHHDDLCDSAAYGPVVWQMYGTVVESQGIHNVAGRIMQAGRLNMNNAGELDVCPF